MRAAAQRWSRETGEDGESGQATCESCLVMCAEPSCPLSVSPLPCRLAPCPAGSFYRKYDEDGNLRLSWPELEKFCQLQFGCMPAAFPDNFEKVPARSKQRCWPSRDVRGKSRGWWDEASSAWLGGWDSGSGANREPGIRTEGD